MSAPPLKKIRLDNHAADPARSADAQQSQVFNGLLRPALHHIFEFLEIKDLMMASTLSSAWSFEMDNEAFWLARFRADMGAQACHQAMKKNNNGWTAKQRLIWELSLLLVDPEVQPHLSQGGRFQHLHNVWVCIVRERKRKYLKALEKKQRQRQIELEKEKEGQSEGEKQEEAKEKEQEQEAALEGNIATITTSTTITTATTITMTTATTTASTTATSTSETSSSTATATVTATPAKNPRIESEVAALKAKALLAVRRAKALKQAQEAAAGNKNTDMDVEMAPAKSI